MQGQTVNLPQRGLSFKRQADPSDPIQTLITAKQPQKRRICYDSPPPTDQNQLPIQPPKMTYMDIQQCPTYNLTTEDMMADPLKLFKRLELQFARFGGIKLRVSEEWSPPYSFRYVDKKVTTRIQNLNELKNGKAFEQKIEAYGVKQFELLALGFQKKYNYLTNPQGLAPQDKNESQFWSLVTDPRFNTSNVKVEYAADLPVSKYGSGFPLTKHVNVPGAHLDYHMNLFNINNLYKSKESLLRIVKNKSERISGVTSPWMYMGMMFSSFCWHVEDLYINSLNYNHQGATKTWYVVPRCDKEKFDDFAKKKLGKVFESKPDILHRITLMMDPLELISSGITVYKINQQERCYVLTFSKAYHAGFCHGFNVGEAVNFVTVGVLEQIKEATLEYKQLRGKKTSIFPIEWLVFQNCKKDYLNQLSEEDQQLLLKQRESMVAIESQRVSGALSDLKVETYCYMGSKFLRYDRNICCLCKTYCYLSLMQCSQCNKKYCLEERPTCCENKFVVTLRQPQEERLGLLELLEREHVVFKENQSE